MSERATGDEEQEEHRQEEPPGHPARRWVDPLMTRRTFLAGTAGVVGMTYAHSNLVLRSALRSTAAVLTEATPIPGSGPGEGGPIADYLISVERPDDLVTLDFAFYHFTLDTGSTPTLVPSDASNVVVVTFPPQAIGEATYPWNGDDLPVDPPPILSDLADPSRLCFNIPLGQSIALKTMKAEDLLDWSGWQLLVPAVAQVNGGIIVQGSQPPYPSAPTQFETSIEFPYALFIAPTVYVGSLAQEFGFSTGFSARTTPLVSPAGVVDLWSTALVGGRDQIHLQGGAPAAPYIPQVSAVWAVDFNPIHEFRPVPDDTPEQFIEYGFEIIT